MKYYKQILYYNIFKFNLKCKEISILIINLIYNNNIFNIKYIYIYNLILYS